MQARIERFGVDTAIERRPRRERGSDGLAVEAARVESGQTEQRGGDVAQAERARDPPSGARAAGQPQDPRHMERFAVQQDSVLRLAVIAEPFAVVRYDRDDRAVEPPA